MFGGNSNDNNNDRDNDNNVLNSWDRKRWHDKLDEVWDMTDRTFGRFSSLNDWGLRDLEDTIGQSLPWLQNAFGSETDTRNAENLWAFPVPSARQYDQCKEANGQSAWSKDGVWRCLFNGEHKNEPNNWFMDYTKYLDWRREMRKNIAAEREKERQRQVQSQSNGPWGWNRNAKYVSESDAERADKSVTSSSVSSETVTKDDGSLETKRVVRKWYDDGTMSLSESTENANDRKGWFWKGSDSK